MTTINGTVGNDTITGSGIIFADGGAGNDSIVGGVNNDTLLGGIGNDTLLGGAGANSLEGGEGSDYITAGSGNDTIIGGLGNDYIAGGAGTNIYSFNVGDGNDTIVDTGTSKLVFGSGITKSNIKFLANGNDLTIAFSNSTDTIKLTNQLVGSCIQTLVFSDGSTYSASEFNNLLEAKNGTAANDTILGSVGSDLIYSLAGNDSIVSSSGFDTVYAGDGNDYVISTGSLYADGGVDNDTLVSSIYADTLDGGAGDDTLNGGAGNDSLIGGDGRDTISGGAGNDTIYGGLGNDVLSGNDGSNAYIFNLGDGNDTIYDAGTSSISFGNGIVKTNLVFEGAGTNLTIKFNNSSDSLFLSNQLSGSYIKSLIFSDGTSYSSGEICNLLSAVNGTANNDIMLGSYGGDKLYGNGGADSILGYAGDDLIYGGDGNDTISSSDGSDTVYGGIGNDVIFDSYGKSSETNLFYGEDGNDSISAGYFNDTIYGGNGNDTIVDTNGRNYIDGGDGSDSIVALSGIDTIIGGTGNDYLNGGSSIKNYIYNLGDGSDTIVGTGAYSINFGADFVKNNVQIVGSGKDLLLKFTNSTDIITLVNQSNSPTLAGLFFADGSSYTLDDITSALRPLYGTDGNDSLVGTVGNDLIYGYAGNDTIVPLAGNDLIYAGSGNDSIYDTAGNDTIYADVGDDTICDVSGANYIDAGDGNDSILGGSGMDTINGSFGNDTINGGLGVDSLIGGEGNDFYIVDNSADAVFEALSGGVDVVNSSVSYTISENVENLTLTGTSAINGTGNLIDNYLLGNSAGNILYGFEGNDTLDGAAGVDTLYGGLGNDSYIVDNINDSVVENIGEGTDTVYSSVSYTLKSNVENIILTGNSTIDATGNALDNIITGNSSNNILKGSLGNDTLMGDAGDDTYLFSKGDGIDEIIDILGNDVLKFDASVSKTDLYFLQKNNNLLIRNRNSSDIITIDKWYNPLENKVESIMYSDGSTVAIDPILMPINQSINEDSFLNLDVLAEFNGQLVVDSFTQGAHGSITKDLNNNLVYTPTADYNGTDSFIYTLIDANGGTLTRTVNLNIIPVNDAPQANLTSGVLDEDNSIILDVMAQSSDVDADSLVISNFTQATNGVIVKDAENRLVYTPVANYNGADAFTYTISDGNGGSVTKTVSLTINSVNDNPTASLDSGSINEDNAIILDVLASASDVDGDVLSITDFTQGQYGSVLQDFDGALVYTPNSDYSGSDLFTYTISDGNGGSVTKTVNLTILPYNDAPVGGDISATLKEDSAVILDVLANATDIDGDILSIDSFTQGAHGTITVTADNKLLYTPALHYSGNDSFTYTISDGNGGVVTQTASVIITPLPINVTGGSGDDLLEGNYKNNVINGGAGADSMIGGLGNDIYYVDNINDLIIENLSEGNDTVYSSVSYTLIDNVESIVLTGANQIDGFGNSSSNNLIGNSAANLLEGYAGNDILNGGAGADTMIGGIGSDTYYIDNIGDVVIENSGEGTDSVSSAVSYTLGDNLENFALSGSASINGIGNDLTNIINGNSAANILIGNGGNDTLNGSTGADTMIGGIGNDYYYVNEVGDVIIENSGEGIDAVASYISYTLDVSLENITLQGSAAINGYGNDSNNSMSGNSGNNLLVGYGGNDVINASSGVDTMIGGTGNDVYYVDNINDLIVENLSEGNDTVYTSVSYTISSNVEYFVLNSTASINGYGSDTDNYILGGTGNNILSGGAGNDTLNGSSGIDTMYGGTGNDTMYVQNVGDVVIEYANEGTDLIYSAISMTIPDNVENLTMTGVSAINAIGNDLNNYIIGNAINNILEGGLGNDTLNGSTGNDTMIGEVGDDVYYTDSSSDVIIENANEGIDTVNSSYSYTLGVNLENLVLTSTVNHNGTGNALDNVITGTIGNNALNGMSGADTMIGRLGNDTYYVDNVGDVIIENVNEGTDTVSSSIDYTLSSALENLTLTGTAISGIGNALDNNITGNASNNLLSAGAGNDTLNGSTGVDTMYGGTGNDIYYVDNVSDIVTEYSNEGTDLVSSSVTYTIGSNIENLTLTGTSVIYGYGNELDNYIIGNSAVNYLYGYAGNDTINGSTGADRMYGGTGNDTYYFDNGSDVVIENANEGTDTVNSSISYTMANNVENLTLTGASTINGTGNTLDNYIKGNTAINSLNGAAGNDTLVGMSGNDILLGGAGDDTYIFNYGDAVDNITDASGSELISFDASVVKDKIALFISGNNLVIDYGAVQGQDKINVIGQVNAANAVEKVQLGDGTYMSNTDINQLIQTMTAYANANGIQMTSVADVKNNQDLMNLVANAWHS